MKTKRTKSKPVAPQPKPPRQTYAFSLIFRSPGELTDELENAVLEVGCQDALLGIQGKELFLDFRREAPSFHVALMSALYAIERTGLGLDLQRIERA